MRRIGVLVASPQTIAEWQARLAAFMQGLQQLGWTDGRNVRIDTRWGTANADDFANTRRNWPRSRRTSLWLPGTTTAAPLLQATRTVPIVFAIVVDPVGAGFVASLARPGGNATGFTMFEYGMSGKWLELLKADRARRDAGGSPSGSGHRLRDRAVRRHPGGGTVAGGGIEPSRRARCARNRARRRRLRWDPNGGLVVTASPSSTIHRDLIIALAARHKLPAVYWERFYVAAGGLISYGPDRLDQYRQAAGYVDRILKGEKAADLPVQVPTKFQIVINQRTAKALGITVPPVSPHARRRGD